MRPYILSETNWYNVKQTEFDLAILPWGATEAHNYHLPYACDNIESDLIAAESARIAWEKGGKVIVLPTIPFGVNTGQSDIYLDINMNPSTQLCILNDIIEGLNRQGIYKLMIFNSHGGNDFKPFIRELGLRFPKMFICTSNWFQALQRNDYFENSGDHAEEMETSLMLYLKPELVLPKEKWGNGKAKRNRIDGFNEGWIWAERKWSKVTEDTGIGDPILASKEKGEKFFAAVTKKIGNVMYEICIANGDDRYV
ncbi:MAG: creatininase family protein [Prolixibacteraceae bacterium]